MRPDRSCHASSTNPRRRRHLRNSWRAVSSRTHRTSQKGGCFKAARQDYTRWPQDSLDHSRRSRCLHSHGDSFRVLGLDRHRASGPHDFLGSSDNSFQHYCGGTAILGQDPAIERCHLVRWDKGNSRQGKSEVDPDQNSRRKYYYNREWYADEWTLYQLFSRRTSRGKTLA